MNKSLTIVHCVPVTGFGSCGMLGTALDIMEAEKEAGHKPFLYDPRPTAEENAERVSKTPSITCPNCREEITAGENQLVRNDKTEIGHEEHGFCTVDYNFVVNRADFIISHSGLDEKLQRSEYNTPYIHIAHGRPYSSFLLEKSGQVPIYTIYRSLDNDKNLKKVVTLWEMYKPYLKVLFQKKDVEVLNSPVNTNYWYPFETDFNFSGRKGDINVVCTDIWRMDKDPYYIIHGFKRFSEKYPNAKLHMYACKEEKGWSKLINTLKEMNITGELAGLVPPEYLRHVYNAADIVITPHKIATRTVREPLSCGTSVVCDIGNKHTPYTADVEDVEAYANAIESAWKDIEADREQTIKRNRDYAIKTFDSSIMASQLINLIESSM